MLKVACCNSAQIKVTLTVFQFTDTETCLKTRLKLWISSFSFTDSLLQLSTKLINSAEPKVDAKFCTETSHSGSDGHNSGNSESERFPLPGFFLFFPPFCCCVGRAPSRWGTVFKPGHLSALLPPCTLLRDQLTGAFRVSVSALVCSVFSRQTLRWNDSRVGQTDRRTDGRSSLEIRLVFSSEKKLDVFIILNMKLMF